MTAGNPLQASQWDGVEGDLARSSRSALCDKKVLDYRELLKSLRCGLVSWGSCRWEELTAFSWGRLPGDPQAGRSPGGFPAVWQTRKWVIHLLGANVHKPAYVQHTQYTYTHNSRIPTLKSDTAIFPQRPALSQSESLKTKNGFFPFINPPSPRA